MKRSSVAVEQVAALAATALGHEDVRAEQGRRVELDEFHVAQRDAGVVGMPMPAPVLMSALVERP